MTTSQIMTIDIYGGCSMSNLPYTWGCHGS